MKIRGKGAPKEERGKRPVARLRAVTATGPIYQTVSQSVVLPLASGFALLQELARRTVDPKARVVACLANRVAGKSAYATWLAHSIRIATGLTVATPALRRHFLRYLLTYLRQHGPADGLEPMLMAAINASWPWMGLEETKRVIAYQAALIKRSNFSDTRPSIACDPLRRTVAIVGPGKLKDIDTEGWLEWRSSLHDAWNTQGRGFEWADVGRPDWETWGPSGPQDSGGSGPGGLFGGSEPGSHNPFGEGGIFGGGAGAGGASRGFGAGGNPNRPGSTGQGPGGVFGGGEAGARDPFGESGPFGGGAGTGGRGRGFGGNAGQGQSGGMGPGGLFTGGEAGSGGVSGLGLLGGLNGTDFGAAGGPFGHGSFPGLEGASDFWGDVAQGVGKGMQYAGTISASIGGGLIVAGAAQDATIVLAVTGTGTMITGAEVMLAGAGVGILGIAVEKWGEHRNKAEAGSSSPKTETEVEKKTTVITIPTVVVDDSDDTDDDAEKPKPKDSRPGDLYPDPNGGGDPSPTQLPDNDGRGGGDPTTIWDEDGGGGTPDTIWDENGGGGTPNTIGREILIDSLGGPGLRASIVQVGRQVFRY